jgi:hypothetical protein
VPATIANPTFVDGTLVGQADLNRLSFNLDALSQNLLGKPASAGYSTKPICKVNLTSNFSVPTGAGGTNQIVTWNNVVFDNDGMWPGSPADHMVIQTPGWYRIMAQAWWASAAASERVVQILINGIADPLNVVATTTQNLGSTSAYHHQVVAYEHLQAGASLYVGVFQNSGASLNLTTNNSVGSWGTWWTCAWHAPY